MTKGQKIKTKNPKLKSKIKSFLILGFIFLFFVFNFWFLLPAHSKAADFNLTPPGIGVPCPPENPDCPEGEGFKAQTPDFLAYLEWLYKVLLGSTGILAFLMIVIGGIMYIIAGASGNPENIKTAKTMVLSAVGGLLLALGSWILLNTINPDLLKFNLTLPAANSKSSPPAP